MQPTHSDDASFRSDHSVPIRHRCRDLLVALAAAVLPDAATADPPPGSGAWQVVFQDDFDGTELDLTKWSTGYANGPYHHHQKSEDENIVVADGLLNLICYREDWQNLDYAWNDPESRRYGRWNDTYRVWVPYRFVTGVVNTSDTFVTSGGYFEARIKVPDTPGSWPAFWMLREGVWPPEIDILEHVIPLDPSNQYSPNAGTNKLFANYHWRNSDGSRGSQASGFKDAGVDLSQDFHTYSMLWSGNRLEFFLDGWRYHVVDRSQVSQAYDFYMILNYAFGGWAGVPDENAWSIGEEVGRTQIDWVRVWQPVQVEPPVWSLTADAQLAIDLAIDGRLVEAVNTGTQAPSPAAEAVVRGVRFEPTDAGLSRLGASVNPAVYADQQAADGPGVQALLSAGVGYAFDGGVRSTEITVGEASGTELVPGNRYRLQLVIGHPYDWAACNLYAEGGNSGLYRYNPGDPNNGRADVSIASLEWTAGSTSRTVSFDIGSGQGEAVLLGYAVHDLSVSTCGPADLAEPLGTLDLFDILGFFGLFGAADPAADLDASGTLDLFDILGFFDLFGAGC